jgi:hypothetical protein
MRKSWVGMVIGVAAGAVISMPSVAQAIDIQTTTTVTVQQNVTVAAPVSVSVQINGQPAGTAATRAERRAARHQK